MKPVCAVVGIGPGNGAALARRFAREGYAVALLARSRETSDALAAELGDARAYACDVADEASVKAAFAAIRAEMGEVDVVAYNAGSGTWGTIDDIKPEAFEAVVAGQRARPVPRRAGGDPGDEGEGRGQHRRDRRDRVAARHAAHHRLRAGQGGAEEPRRGDGAPPLAARHPRRR